MATSYATYIHTDCLFIMHCDGKQPPLAYMMAQYAKINDNIKVLMKLIIPKIEDMSAKMQTESSHIHTWPRILMPPNSGRYKVQLFPASSSTRTDQTNEINAGSNNQKLKLFNFGNAISGNPIHTKEHTNSQIPNQHRNYKKIIIKPCAVTKTLSILLYHKIKFLGSQLKLHYQT